MDESRWLRVYRQEAEVLGELGVVLARADLPRFEVRVPRHLADKAVAAWKRDDDEGDGEPETWENDEVVVELSPDLIGVAVDASDDLPT